MAPQAGSADDLRCILVSGTPSSEYEVCIQQINWPCLLLLLTWVSTDICILLTFATRCFGNSNTGYLGIVWWMNDCSLCSVLLHDSAKYKESAINYLSLSTIQTRVSLRNICVVHHEVTVCRFYNLSTFLLVQNG